MRKPHADQPDLAVSSGTQGRAGPQHTGLSTCSPTLPPAATLIIIPVKLLGGQKERKPLLNLLSRSYNKLAHSQLLIHLGVIF